MIFNKILSFGFICSIVGYDLQCPHQSQRAPRIQSVCYGNSSAYSCLNDTRKKHYIEFCTDRTDNYVRAGLKYVISGTFRNSQCIGIGQFIYNNISTIYEATCGCDYKRGYAFVSKTRDPCFCLPSEEDCSCYIKECQTHTSLSPDYECTSTNLTNVKFYCKPFTNRSTHPNKTDLDVLYQDKARIRSGQVYISVLILGSIAMTGDDVQQVDLNDCSPLMIACGKGHLTIVKLLIEQGADLNIIDNVGQTPFYWSCLGKTPLDWSCAGGNIDIVNLLKDKGCDLHKPNSTGQTPLMEACGNGNLSVVELLIGKGDDINITDNKGQTPFYWSCSGGNIDIVNLLIDKGCEIDTHNNDMHTPLIEACGKGHLSIVKLLIEKGADIDSADNIEQTPLYWSCSGETLI
ncbi:unnamed protein product [Mytilus edulis]|uniref:Uncharacterized protein n=1 Tax=Mytilus edulis TaxID=6550 RepID=A0A8S3TFQ7_MYTED|nr:unnamed protein product [Mytilus edulis]